VKGFLAAEGLPLKPGMFANIDLILQVRRGVLTVPEGAVLTTPQGTQLIAVREKGSDKVAEMVPVTLGLRERGLVEVTPLKPEALGENVPVVASGVGGLIIFPGSVLEPRPLRQEFRIGE
jgi:membrane fusion protein (multidrug efflux system)